MQVETFVVPRCSIVPGVVLPELVHGNNVAQVVNPTDTFHSTDGVWTEKTDIILGVTTADCAPICFSDGARIGVAHVGWRGLAKKLIPNMLEHFQRDSLEVYIGPHLHEFTVKRDHCYDMLQAEFGSAFFTQQNDHITFNFTQALLSCLPVVTQVDERNTHTDMLLPSYRHGRNSERIVTTVRF